MRVLICLLFKDSFFWLARFIYCIESLLRDKPNDINYHLSIIHGDSKDGTDGELKRYTADLLSKYKSTGLKIKMVELPLPSRLNRIERLAVLRNACIVMVDIEDYDYVLAVDTDVMFEPCVIKKLIEDIRNDKLNAGIVAPMIMIEGAENAGKEYFYDTWVFRIAGKTFTSAAPYIPAGISPDIATGIFEVDSVGSFYIARAGLFSRYGIKYFTEERKDIRINPQLKYESEQVCFCNDVRKRTPYKIYVDPKVMVHHVNLEQYGLKWH